MARDENNRKGAFIAVKISLIYALAGCLWILFTDRILFRIVRDPSMASYVEIFKGWLFIAITAVILYLIIGRYIEAVHKSEQALKESEERLSLLVQEITDYEIFMLDPEGCILIWNTGAELEKGYNLEEVIGKHHSIFFTREDIEKGLPDIELKKAVENGSFENEGWRVRKDGSRFWADVITTALRDKTGRLQGFSKVVRDITERKITEEKLRESEERHRIIAQTASDTIITIDEESRILFANQAVEKVFGYSPDEIIGRSLAVLMPERLRAAHQKGMKRFLETGVRGIRWEAAELPGLHKDGHEVPLEISYGFFKKEGRYFFTGIVRDITERKQAEKEKQYKDMLERFNQELEILVSERTMNIMALRLADRVRTPASVIGWAGKKLLGREEVSGRIREAVSTMVDEAGKLEEMVREFHALLKSKREVFAYEDLNKLVAEVLSLIDSEASRKGVRVVARLSGSPLKINAQKELLRMAIFNLLRNAIETTSENGIITVVTEVAEEKVVLRISDTGRGIPAAVLDRIFDPLLSASIYRFGMGLPLVKQIVTEHLGEIELRSVEGQGTIVNISFPMRWTEAMNRKEPSKTGSG